MKLPQDENVSNIDQASELRKKQEELGQYEGQLHVAPDLHVLTIELDRIKTTLRELKKEEQFVKVRYNEMTQKYQELVRMRTMYEQNLKQMELSLRRLKPEERQAAMAEIGNQKRVITSILEKSSADFRRFRDEVVKLQARLADIEDQKKRLTVEKRQKDQDMVTARRVQFMRDNVTKLKSEIADLKKKMK